MAGAVSIPVIAIADVTTDRVGELLAAGAYGVAVIGALSDAEDPFAAARHRRGGRHVNGSDVAVVGGGVIGLACAWRLAQRGASVTVFDPEPGAGASHAAAGMLAPATEVHHGEEPLLALNLASAQLWPAFAVELVEVAGIDIGYRTDGTLAVASTTTT